MVTPTKFSVENEVVAGDAVWFRSSGRRYRVRPRKPGELPDVDSANNYVIVKAVPDRPWLLALPFHWEGRKPPPDDDLLLERMAELLKHGEACFYFGGEILSLREIPAEME